MSVRGRPLVLIHGALINARNMAKSTQVTTVWHANGHIQTIQIAPVQIRHVIEQQIHQQTKDSIDSSKTLC